MTGVAARLDTRLRLEADPRLEAGLDSSTVQYSTIQYSTWTVQYLDSGPVAELLDTDPHSSDRGGGRARRRRTRGSPILGALGKYYEDNVKTIVFGYLLILSPHPGAGRGRAGAGRARPGPRPRPAPRPRLPEAARPALCGHVDILTIMAMLALLAILTGCTLEIVLWRLSALSL